MRIPPPVIEGLARKYFYKHLTIASIIGVAVAEGYWHFHVIPRRKKRDAFFEHFGIEYDKMI